MELYEENNEALTRELFKIFNEIEPKAARKLFQFMKNIRDIEKEAEALQQVLNEARVGLNERMSDSDIIRVGELLDTIKYKV